MKTSSLGSFIAILTIALLATALLHVVVRLYLDIDWTADLFVPSYIFNYFLALISGVLLFQFRVKLADKLGFIYFGLSLVKFVFFFLLFYPTYKEDGDVSRAEFSTFFIPYAICLALETRFLVKELNKM
jgi:uncharacterized membrane protein YidH (DUF202 family)